MKTREEAEGDEDNRPAHPARPDRNVGGSATGAASASSGESHCTGTGEGLIERMIESDNINAAWKQVRGNKGAAGVDGLDIEQSAERIRREWDGIKTQLLAGTYRPEPVRRVEIPKASGGTRKLGVPTVQDRLIQQAALQVLSPLFEPGFSSHSYGFRPGRSAHQAVLAAQRYQEAGKRWVVDIDLASFFDEVNHDLLMARVRRKVKDTRMVKLIRSFLNAGVMIGGLAQTTDKGTPQGGPLSPLLSNIMLDDLDKELEKRGHSFCRYADDCNIYVGSQQGGERVMDSITGFLERKLKLKVNRDKSAVDRPWIRVFLGYSFTAHKQPKVRVPEKTCRKMREKLKERFRAGQGRNVARFIRETLNPLLRGWMNYFRLSQTKGFAEVLDGWVRRRLRGIIWRQWKRPATRFKRLCALGLDVDRARKSASNGRGGWFNSGASHMNTAYPKLTFDALGLLSLSDLHRSLTTQPLRNRRDT
jgi:RNA-directed DNA polymerase